MEFLLKLSRRLIGERKEEVTNTGLPDHNSLVESARLELQAAQSIFNNVSEVDLIDHAIYKINAAERRYVFLLQEAKRLRSDMRERLAEGGNPDREK